MHQYFADHCNEILLARQSAGNQQEQHDHYITKAGFLVLGVDNVVFISILAGKLPPEQQRKARLLGLSLAMFLRIGLLFLASRIVGLT